VFRLDDTRKRIGINGVSIYDSNVTGSGLTPYNILLGSRLFNGTPDRPLHGVMGSFYVGAAIGVDLLAWNTDLWQCQNELQIGQASTVDYNVQDNTYDWSNRELAADQLEELTSVIDSNSDGTTTGRTFDITGNLGITLNCQVSLDSLVAKGFAIIQ